MPYGAAKPGVGIQSFRFFFTGPLRALLSSSRFSSALLRSAFSSTVSSTFSSAGAAFPGCEDSGTTCDEPVLLRAAGSGDGEPEGSGEGDRDGDGDPLGEGDGRGDGVSSSSPLSTALRLVAAVLGFFGPGEGEREGVASSSSGRVVFDSFEVVLGLRGGDASLSTSALLFLATDLTLFGFLAGGEGGGDSVASLSSTTALVFGAAFDFFAAGEGGGDSVASLSSITTTFFFAAALDFFARGEGEGEGVSSSSVSTTCICFPRTGSFPFFLGAAASSSEVEGVSDPLSSPARAAVFFSFPREGPCFAVGADLVVARRVVGASGSLAVLTSSSSYVVTRVLSLREGAIIPSCRWWCAG